VVTWCEFIYQNSENALGVHVASPWAPSEFSPWFCGDQKAHCNGGHVGLDTGYDIVFTSGDGKTKYAHEIESYSETGNEQNATGVC